MSKPAFTDEDEIAFIDGIGSHQEGSSGRSAKQGRERHISMLHKYIENSSRRPGWGRFIWHAQETLNRLYRDERQPTPSQSVKIMMAKFK